MTSYPSPRTYPRRSTPAEPSGSGVLVKVVAVFLGIAVAVLSVVAVVLAPDRGRCARRRAGAAPAATDHSSHTSGSSAVSLPLQSFAGTDRENAEALARRTPPTTRRFRRCRRATSSRSTCPQGHGRRDRARREVQHLGVRRPRRAGPGRPRPRGPDRRDDARRTAARSPTRSTSMPRASRPTSPSGRRPRRVVHLPLRGRRPRRLHVPLRDEAGARAHRERHVRRDRRRSREPLPKVDHEYVLVASEWYLYGDGIDEPACSTWRRRARCSPTGRPSTATRTST